MDKPIAELIKDLKNMNTNDPAMQRRVVKVLERILIELVALEEKANPRVYRNFGGQ